jgi:hypothetical protein
MKSAASKGKRTAADLWTMLDSETRAAVVVMAEEGPRYFDIDLVQKTIVSRLRSRKIRATMAQCLDAARAGGVDVDPAWTLAA